MDDFDEFGAVVKKENRRKKLEPKTHVALMSAPPASMVHELSRKEKERLEKKKLDELIK